MQPILPPDVAAHYSAASDLDVRSESFGLLKVARFNADCDWQLQRGTFDDQAIFGTMRRYACACGKYEGSRCADVVCDRCGVLVTTPEGRQSRCAHLNLPVQIIHPLGDGSDRLSVAPVLPIGLVESFSGRALLKSYNELLAAQEQIAVLNAFIGLIRVLSPLLVELDRWNLPARLLIAHGMALKARAE